MGWGSGSRNATFTCARYRRRFEQAARLSVLRPSTTPHGPVFKVAGLGPRVRLMCIAEHEEGQWVAVGSELLSAGLQPVSFGQQQQGGIERRSSRECPETAPAILGQLFLEHIEDHAASEKCEHGAQEKRRDSGRKP